MADMYGAVRSNVFKVKDGKAFRIWFESNVKFGDDIEIWVDEDNSVSFGGYEQYPSAWPHTVEQEDKETEEDVYFESEPWDLDAFAVELRKHLQAGEQFRVLAAGNEKLRYVAAQHLVITTDTAQVTDLYEGN